MSVPTRNFSEKIRKRAYVLGIAGFIGSGKSTVAKIFEKQGALHIDADKVVSQLYEPGKEGYEKIKNFFGEEYVLKNGQLNRRKLAKVVFQDPQKLKILHALIHPLVTAEIQKMIDQSRQPFIVVEATYFEKKFLRPLISALLWIETSPAIAYARIHKARDLAKPFFEKIRRIQEKPEKIDYIVTNNSTISDLTREILKIDTPLPKGNK